MSDLEAKENYALRDKLCEYQKSEQDIGIGLATLFRALEDGIYVKSGDIKIHAYPQLCLKGSYLYVEFIPFVRAFTEIYYFKDLGDTWALTREGFK